MFYSVDLNSEYKKSKTKFLSYSLLFAFILAAVLTCDTLCVALSKEDYNVALIITMVVTVLFCWFAIFFFSCIYNDINARYRFFKGVNSGQVPTEEVIFVSMNPEMVIMNGLYVYAINVKYEQNFITRDKLIYTFEPNLDLKQGDKIAITTYRRILLKAEKHS